MMTTLQEKDTMISPQTIALCLDLLSTVSIPINLPDGDEKWQACRAAYQELTAALSSDQEGVEE